MCMPFADCAVRCRLLKHAPYSLQVRAYRCSVIGHTQLAGNHPIWPNGSSTTTLRWLRLLVLACSGYRAALQRHTEGMHLAALLHPWMDLTRHAGV
jgi:hypothetical protein